MTLLAATTTEPSAWEDYYATDSAKGGNGHGHGHGHPVVPEPAAYGAILITFCLLVLIFIRARRNRLDKEGRK